MLQANFSSHLDFHADSAPIFTHGFKTRVVIRASAVFPDSVIYCSLSSYSFIFTAELMFMVLILSSISALSENEDLYPDLKF